MVVVELRVLVVVGEVDEVLVARGLVAFEAARHSASSLSGRNSVAHSSRSMR